MHYEVIWECIIFSKLIGGSVFGASMNMRWELGRNDAMPKYTVYGRSSKGVVRGSIAEKETIRSEESARRLAVFTDFSVHFSALSA